MAVTRMCPNPVHFSEFQNDPVTGHHYTGACGWAAFAAAAVSASLGITETTQQAIDFMCGVTRNAIAAGRSDPNGVTTMKGIHGQAIAEGFTPSTPYIEWQDPISDATLHPLLLDNAGIKPIVLMVTNGQALHATNGSHTEAGLHGHFICVLGINPAGYDCQDGDNNMITSAMPIYPWSAIQAAHVTGFLMLEYNQPPDSELAKLLAKLKAENAALTLQVSALEARIAAAQKALG